MGRGNRARIVSVARRKAWPIQRVRDGRAISIADPIFILDMQSAVSRFHKQARGGTADKKNRGHGVMINLARDANDLLLLSPPPPSRQASFPFVQNSAPIIKSQTIVSRWGQLLVEKGGARISAN